VLVVDISSEMKEAPQGIGDDFGFGIESSDLVPGNSASWEVFNL
jgi:hypothetical protein